MKDLSLKTTQRLLSSYAIQPWWERLQASPLGYRLASGFFWSIIGAFFSRIIGLLSSVFIARMLGKEGFGELGIIHSTVGLFAVFASLGMGMTAAKYVAEYREKDPARAGRIIGLCSLLAWVTGLIIMCVVVVLAPWLAAQTLAAPHLKSSIRLGSFMLLFGAVSAAQNGELNGLEAFRSSAVIGVICSIISFPMTIFGVWLFGLQGAVVALVVSEGFSAILKFLSLRVEARKVDIPLGWSGVWQEAEIVWKFSIPAILSGIMVAPVTWLANAMIVNCPNGYAAMGIFNAANQWKTAIVFLPTLLAGVALPMLTNLRAKADGNSYRQFLWTNLKLNLLSSFVIGTPIALFASWIMSGYGEGFAEGSQVLVILCIVSVITTTLNVVGQAIASEGRMWNGFFLNSIWAIVFIYICWLDRTNGALGLSIAYLVAYAVHLVTVSIYVYYRIQGLT